jgi:hypothetical protein
MRNILPFAMLLATCFVAAPGARAESAAVCGGRATCRVTERHPAGTDPAGAPLTVLRVALGLRDRPSDAPKEGCRTRDGNARDGGEEYWLLRPGSAPRRILALCNDGYGASGVGEDQVTVGRNLLVHDRYGGSGLRWTDRRDIRLEPSAVVRHAACSFRSTGGPGRSGVFDALGFIAWAYADRVRDPDEVGCPEAPANGGPGAAGLWTARAIVAPSLPAEVAAGRRMPRLGGCALRLSTAEPSLAFGRPAPATEAAELRAVALRGEGGTTTLLVQVTDPLATRTPTRPPRSWVDLPHAELWLGDAREEASADGRNVTAVAQFGILPDGRVERGFGSAFPPPTVTREEVPGSPGILSLRVVLPQEALIAGIGLAYSQAVEGRQARLVSSAPLERGRPAFLPLATDTRAPCRVADGVLEPAPWWPLD